MTSEPKTSSARRSISLPRPAVDALRRRRVTQLEEQLIAGRRWQDTGFVFTSTVGTPVEPRNFNRDFARLVDRLGLPQIRVHDLRHTCATIQLSQGTHAKIVQDLLGHSQISLTMDTYPHVLPSMQEEAARTMERVLAGN